MDALSSLADGFAIALTWQNLGLALLGCFFLTRLRKILDGARFDEN